MPEPFNAAVYLVERWVTAGQGERPAVRCQGRIYSYREIEAEIERVGAGLRRLGVKPEQRVALALLDSVPFVAAFLGAMRIGAVPVLINPLLPPRDIALIIADARAGLVLVSAERLSSATIEELRGNAPEVKRVVTTAEWDDVFPSGESAAVYPTWEESPGFWLCTSGSTGQPKLAMHRHIDLVLPAQTYATEVLGISETDVFYSVGPAFHAYGLGNSLAFPFSVGALTVLEPTRPPSPALVAKIMAEAAPTLFFTIPTFTAALNASDLAADTFRSVRLGVSAAEALPAETYHRFLERFGVQILDGIGSTELAHIYCSNRPGDKARAGTSGNPVAGYELRLVDDEDHPIIANGQPGHLLVAGPSLATGYWCRTGQNRAVFLGRYLRTGDMYTRSADGYYTYLGRSDDMLRVGGEWVSPAEVEATLMEHASVLEAAVVGERDDSGVLRPVAYVIRAPGTTADEAALTEHCRTHLAGYKRPKRYLMVDSLPKTATGKIQRFRLR